MDKNRYFELKNMIKDALFDIPEDMVDVQTGVPWGSQYQSAQPRHFGIGDATTKIGSFNILQGLQLVQLVCEDIITENPPETPINSHEFETSTHDIFTSIIEELMEEELITKTPDARRRAFIVHDGGKDTEEDGGDDAA